MPSTSSGASRRSAKQGTFVNSTLAQRPSRHAARTSTTPPGASSRSTVSGSVIGTMPVSSSTVAVQIVFEPDIGGYSVGSMMMNPASQSGRVAGTIRLAWQATLPRGSRSRSRLRPSPWLRRCSICSKTEAPGGGSTPPTTTFPISPPAWQPTTVIVRAERMEAYSIVLLMRASSRVHCGEISCLPFWDLQLSSTFLP